MRIFRLKRAGVNARCLHRRLSVIEALRRPLFIPIRHHVRFLAARLNELLQIRLIAGKLRIELRV